MNEMDISDMSIQASLVCLTVCKSSHEDTVRRRHVTGKSNYSALYNHIDLR